MINLSILILTTPRRVKTFFPSLLDILQTQIGERDDIEILGLFDNKKRSIGEKRNNLLQISNGEYLTFIDDDDKVSDEYIKEIMNSIEKNPETDCIVFDCYSKYDSWGKSYTKFSKEFDYIHNNEQWTAKPSHIMIWKSSLAKKYKFKDISYGEDIEWAKEICKEIRHETIINKVLYYYEYSGKTSEARK